MVVVHKFLSSFKHLHPNYCSLLVFVLRDGFSDTLVFLQTKLFVFLPFHNIWYWTVHVCWRQVKKPSLSKQLSGPKEATASSPVTESDGDVAVAMSVPRDVTARGLHSECVVCQDAEVIITYFCFHFIHAANCIFVVTVTFCICPVLYLVLCAVQHCAIVWNKPLLYYELNYLLLPSCQLTIYVEAFWTSCQFLICWWKLLIFPTNGS